MTKMIATSAARRLTLAAIALVSSLVPATAMAAQPRIELAQAATPSPAQVKEAVKQALASAKPTLRQQRDIRKLVSNYDAQTANADPTTKRSATRTLIEQIGAVLTPSQKAAFQASLKRSLASSTP
jgi:DNA replication protein DnaD